MKNPGIPFVSLLGTSLHAYGKHILDALEKTGYRFSMEQVGILKMIYHFELETLQEIADFSRRDKSAVMRQLNSLEKKKLLVRLPAKEDRRKKKILLTKPAYQLLEHIAEEENRISEKVKAEISEEEMKHFFNILSRMKRCFSQS